MEYRMILKRILMLTTTALFISSCSSLNGNKTGHEAISLDVKHKTFPNGLTVITLENTKLPVFSYYTYYNVGGKFEVPGITGASHFLEHMMFKGAKKYGAKEFDKLVEGNGGKNNAYTTNDLTVYYESLPKEHFAKMVDLEADRMQNLLLEKKSFESERSVVLEERKMRYENSDRGKIYLRMMKEVFKGTPYGTSVIGTIPDLKSVSRDQIYKYFKQYYAPNNAVIVVVGDLDSEEVFSTIEKSFKNIPKSKGLEKAKKDAISKTNFKFKAKFDREIKIKGTSPTPVFNLAFKGVKIGTTDGFILDILSSVLGDGGSSYLNQNYVLSAKPKLSAIYAGNHTLMDSGVFYIFGHLLGSESVSSIKKDLFKTLKRSCDEAVTERSLQKVKNQYLVSMMSGLDTNAGIARFLGDHDVYYGRYDFYKKEMGIYNSITVEQVKSICKKYLVKEKSIFLSIWKNN
jgi:zinc protease